MLSCLVDGQTHDIKSCEGEGLGDVPGTLSSNVAKKELSALEILDGGCNCLDEAQLVLMQTVELYRDDDETKGREHFLELIQGMEWFVKIASASEQLLKIDFAGTSCSGRTLSESVDSLNRILLEVIVAQEQRDWVLLTDLLEYELAPQLQIWREIFIMLRHRGADNFGDCIQS